MPARRKRRSRKKGIRRWEWFTGGAAVLVCLLLYLLRLHPLSGLPPMPSPEELSQQISGALDELYGGGEISPRPLLPSNGDRELPEGEFELHMIDVGQALSVLLRAPTGECALIDAGDRDDDRTVCDYLRAQEVERLDYLIATHPHADHIGGMDAVVKEFEIGKIFLSDLPKSQTPTTKVYTDLLAAIKEKEYKITLAKPGAQFALGDATLTFEGPVREYDELNNTSIVTRVDYGDCAFLIEGDAEEEAEADMLADKRVKPADVLIAGHHGSETSSSLPYLAAVRPAYIGISCGEGNSYGHPHAGALARMEEIGSLALRTDLHGTIVFSSNGTGISTYVDRD